MGATTRNESNIVVKARKKKIPTPRIVRGIAGNSKFNRDKMALSQPIANKPSNNSIWQQNSNEPYHGSLQTICVF